ncbi:MAG: hypothetical protein ACXAEX_18635 [Promethearchaeota archaeon]
MIIGILLIIAERVYQYPAFGFVIMFGRLIISLDVLLMIGGLILLRRAKRQKNKDHSGR